MGCASSVIFMQNEMKGQDETASLFFDMICLEPKDINCIFSSYMEVDPMNEGHVNANELFHHYRWWLHGYAVKIV